MIALTPAYDLLSTRLFIPENEDNEEMALTLNGKKENSPEMILSVLPENLKREYLAIIEERFTQLFPSA